MEGSTVDYRLRTLESSSAAHHASIGSIRGKVSHNETRIAVLDGKLHETAEDVVELKGQIRQGFEKMEEKIDSQFAAWRKAMWASAGLLISAAGVIALFITAHG